MVSYPFRLKELVTLWRRNWRKISKHCQIFFCRQIFSWKILSWCVSLCSWVARGFSSSAQYSPAHFTRMPSAAVVHIRFSKWWSRGLVGTCCDTFTCVQGMSNWRSVSVFPSSRSLCSVSKMFTRSFWLLFSIQFRYGIVTRWVKLG